MMILKKGRNEEMINFILKRSCVFEDLCVRLFLFSSRTLLFEEKWVIWDDANAILTYLCFLDLVWLQLYHVVDGNSTFKYHEYLPAVCQCLTNSLQLYTIYFQDYHLRPKSFSKCSKSNIISELQDLSLWASRCHLSRGQTHAPHIKRSFGFAKKTLWCWACCLVPDEGEL